MMWGHTGGSWGLLCLVWEEKAGRRATTAVDICSAGIEILSTEDGGLRGKILWLEEAVLRVSTITQCVTV